MRYMYEGVGFSGENQRKVLTYSPDFRQKLASREPAWGCYRVNNW